MRLNSLVQVNDAKVVKKRRMVNLVCEGLGGEVTNIGNDIPICKNSVREACKLHVNINNVTDNRSIKTEGYREYTI